MDTRRKQFDQLDLPEKGRLFKDLTLAITSRINSGLSRDEVNRLTFLDYTQGDNPDIAPEIVGSIINRYHRLFQPPQSDCDWGDSRERFREFLCSKGIGLRDFDTIMQKNSSPEKNKSQFLDYLVAYHLLVRNEAPADVITDTYNMIAYKGFLTFTRELSKLSNDIGLELACTASGDTESLNTRETPYVPHTAAVASGFLHFFLSRGGTVMDRAAAILVTPHAWEEVYQPEEWLAYCYGIRGHGVLRFTRQILEALLDVVISKPRCS